MGHPHKLNGGTTSLEARAHLVDVVRQIIIQLLQLLDKTVDLLLTYT